MFKKLIPILIIAILGILDFALIGFAWQNPTQAPPGGNLTLPWIKSGTNVYLTNNSDNVGIGMTNPTIKLAIGDSDTGIQWISDGNLGIYTNNAERIRINNSGNVGIGTTNPDSKFQVSGKVHLSNVFIGGTPTGGTPDYSSYSDSVVGNTHLHISSRSGGNLYLNTQNGSGNVFILPNGGGNVGIGTTAPGAKLDVASGDIRVTRGQNIGPYIAGHTNLGTVETLFGNSLGGIKAGMNIITTWDGTYNDEIVTFRTHDGGTSEGERMRIDKSGNVGIGTTGPSQKLEVAGKILSRESADEWIEFWPEDSAIIADALNPIRFGHATEVDATGWSEKVRIDSAGNVGIGTTAPGAKLDVIGKIRSTQQDSNMELGCQTTACWTNANGIIGFPGPGTQHGQIAFYPGTGFRFINSSSLSPSSDYGASPPHIAIYAASFNTVSSEIYKKDVLSLNAQDFQGMLETINSLPLYKFRLNEELEDAPPHIGVIAEYSPALILTKDKRAISLSDYLNITVGAVKALSNKVSILESGLAVNGSNGNVGIGLTNPTYRLQLPNTADNAGKGQANAWVTYSDIRYKTNIRPISNALDKINQLEGVYFNWKSNNTQDIGLIAQQVEPIIPEVVTTDNEGYKGIDYGKLTSLLIQGIKEQQIQIESQQQQINELKTQLNNLQQIVKTNNQ